MPQLDKVTFLSQFFWLCFFYLGFYFVVLKYFLPKMSRILFFRKKKTSLSQQGVTFLQDLQNQVANTYETLFTKGLSTSNSFFGNIVSFSTNWIHKGEGHTTQLQQMDARYIHALGNSSASEAFALQQSSFSMPSRAFFSKAIDTLVSKKNKATSVAARFASKKSKESKKDFLAGKAKSANKEVLAKQGLTETAGEGKENSLFSLLSFKKGKH